MLWRKISVGMLACAVAGLLLAVGTASAHTLTVAKARVAANGQGQQVLKSGRYTSYQIVTCKKLYPHRTRCTISYEDAETAATPAFACTERVMYSYAAHDDDERGSLKLGVTLVGHGC
jgi:hypothetical protein